MMHKKTDWNNVAWRLAAFAFGFYLGLLISMKANAQESGAQGVSLAADEPDIVGEIITEAVKVIEEEGWTAQDVGDAIRSLRGLYLRDNATRDGRRRWHGNTVGMPVTDAARGVVITTYEDGEVFEDATEPPPKKPPVTVRTKGVPAALAAARLRRKAESGVVSNVTTTVTAGK